MRGQNIQPVSMASDGWVFPILTDVTAANIVAKSSFQHRVRKSIRRVPKEWVNNIKARYNQKVKEGQYQQAAQFLTEIQAIIEPVNMNLATDDDAVRIRADQEAANASARISTQGVKSQREYCRVWGVETAEEQSETESGEENRYKCVHWWRRRIRAKHTRELERAAIAAGIVRKNRQAYSSDNAVKNRSRQNKSNQAILENTEMVNQDGQQFTLAELAEKSISNPAIRRAELMTRIKGFEEVAEQRGDVGEFYTITCPSRMHATSDKYDQTTPRQAQDYLCKVWARIRAKLKRDGIEIYGFRVCEPHKDGCPHWHLLIFTSKQHREPLREVCRRYALQDSPDEPGADQYRFEAKAIDPAKGTAAGYIAKYIAKNIDGYGIERDLFGIDPDAAAERVRAWAATWNIRQFQQVGGPSVTVWRELRRLDTQQAVESLEHARQAADFGEWSRFVEVMGGPVIERKKQSIQLWKRDVINRDTGEIKLNRYHEPATGQIFGLIAGQVMIPTRLNQWSIVKNDHTQPNDSESSNHAGRIAEDCRQDGNAEGEFLAEQAVLALDSYGTGVDDDYRANQERKNENLIYLDEWQGGQFCDPWTRVNNCTPPSDGDNYEGYENYGNSTNTTTENHRRSQNRTDDDETEDCREGSQASVGTFERYAR